MNQPPDEQTVYNTLRGVMDPELTSHSILDLGIVRQVDIDAEGQVTIDIQLTTPHCPFANRIAAEIHDAVAQLKGVSKVVVQPYCE